MADDLSFRHKKSWINQEARLRAKNNYGPDMPYREGLKIAHSEIERENRDIPPLKHGSANHGGNSQANWPHHRKKAK